MNRSIASLGRQGRDWWRAARACQGRSGPRRLDGHSRPPYCDHPAKSDTSYLDFNVIVGIFDNLEGVGVVTKTDEDRTRSLGRGDARESRVGIHIKLHDVAEEEREGIAKDVLSAVVAEPDLLADTNWVGREASEAADEAGPGEAGEGGTVASARMIDEQGGVLLEGTIGGPVQRPQLIERAADLGNGRAPGAPHRTGGLGELGEHVDLHYLGVGNSSTISQALHLLLPMSRPKIFGGRPGEVEPGGNAEFSDVILNNLGQKLKRLFDLFIDPGVEFRIQLLDLRRQKLAMSITHLVGRAIKVQNVHIRLNLFATNSIQSSILDGSL